LDEIGDFIKFIQFQLMWKLLKAPSTSMANAQGYATKFALNDPFYMLGLQKGVCKIIVSEN